MSPSSRYWFTCGLLAVACCSIASALPVFPGAVGFGTQTVAGRGGQVYRVTNLNDSGPGSLRYGVENISGPRVIIFDVSGVIELRSNLIVRNNGHSHLTIAGQTAPPPGITLKNGVLLIRTHDVLIQHIALRPGNFTTNAPGWNLSSLDTRDAIEIGGQATDAPYNIVIDHVTCSWSVDGVNDVATGSTSGATIYNVTFSNCILGTPIQYGGHSKGRHGYGGIIADNTIGATNQSVSLIRNLMAFNWARNPRIAGRTSGAQVVNNVIYRPGASWLHSGINIGNAESNYPTLPMTVSAIGNVLIRHPVPFTLQDPINGPQTYTNAPARVVAVQSDASSAVSVYVNNNSLYDPATDTWFKSPTTDQWSTPLFSEDTSTTHLSSNPHANSGGTTWSPWTTNIESQVLATVGKHPGVRDAIDAALIANVQSHGPSTSPGIGTFLSHFGQLGTNPWAPVDIQNTRVLTLPTTNWTLDSDGDGYTDIEEWLHGWAAIVETPLVAPGSLTATAAGSSQINLAWADNSNNEAGYRVKRSTTPGGGYQQVGGDLSANTTSFNNTGLSSGTTYYYVVTAFNAGGESANSNEASASTQSSGGGGGFQESGGEVVMEAEHFHALDGRTDPNGVNWQTASLVAGAVGGEYLQTPGTLGTLGTWANACEASYLVNFTTTGTYNVWVRRYAVDGDQNSGFAGLSGVQTTAWDNQTSNYGVWAWKKLATVSVSSAGVQTFQLRRREAGYKVDRILLRKSGATPSGNGPAESPQVAFQESGGEVVMEAEHFHALDGRTDPNGVNWQTATSVGSAVGGQYLQTPGTLGTLGTWANACEASYQVNFSTTGTYNVWVRRYAVDGDQNSGFAGLSGEQTTAWDNQTSNYGAWAWKPLATVSVSSPGVKTFQLRRREAGYKVDRIILRTSSATPSGNGPAESPQ